MSEPDQKAPAAAEAPIQAETANQEVIQGEVGAENGATGSQDAPQGGQPEAPAPAPAPAPQAPVEPPAPATASENVPEDAEDAQTAVTLEVIRLELRDDGLEALLIDEVLALRKQLEKLKLDLRHGNF